MTNQSTVPHTEVSLRMTILSEFLFDEEKSVKELYKSWTRRIGGRIIDFAKFEYWCRRFQNNQFDLGYDTSLNEKEISEIQDTMVPEASGKKDVSTMTVEVKSDNQFEENSSPRVFETHGENTVFGDPNAIQVANDNRSETSNVSNEVNIDPGYSTTQDSKEISEVQNTMISEANEAKNDPPVVIEKKDQVETLERKMEDSKLNYQFNEKDVPKAFQNLMKEKMDELRKIELIVHDQYCTIMFDEFDVLLTKQANFWMIAYMSIWGIKTEHPEKSIIDHLWFVLKNPGLKLERFDIIQDSRSSRFVESVSKVDFVKLNTLLQSMMHSIDHQFHAKFFRCEGCNEDMFFSFLKHVDPGTLNLNLESITPEVVLHVTEHVFNSADKKCYTLSSNNKKLDINAILDALQSQYGGLNITDVGPFEQYTFKYIIMKLIKFISVYGNGNKISIQMD